MSENELKLIEELKSGFITSLQAYQKYEINLGVFCHKLMIHGYTIIRKAECIDFYKNKVAIFHYKIS